jgi:hypothetical protein
VSLALGIGFLIAVTRKRPGSRLFANAETLRERTA